MTFRVFKHLKDITAPTLVVTGRDDILIPAANSEILAKEIPGAELRSSIMLDTASSSRLREQFITVFQDFLARHPL